MDRLLVECNQTKLNLTVDFVRLRPQINVLEQNPT